MKDLNIFRKFLNEELNEGLFDEFKKELGDVLKKVGEMAEITVPSGTIQLEITKISRN